MVQRGTEGGPRAYHFTAAGFAEIGTTVPGNAAGRPIDPAELDLGELAAVLAGAPASVRSAQGAVEHLGIGFPPAAPVDAEPVVQIFVEDPAGGTGHLSVSFTGVPLSVFPVR